MKFLGLDGGRDSISNIAHVRLSLSVKLIVSSVLVSVVAHAAVVALSEEIVLCLFIVTEVDFMISHRVTLPEILPTLQLLRGGSYG